ncbi:MAG: exosome complex RNA-binding protein Csl4 [Candidatus Diapherotrites archaeon]|nr:exosome complex RNA-binding protein Csl4 [Candidatus Diapherotrites archaeon]
MNRLVFPGSLLGKEEAYSAGPNAFVDEQGSVRAESVGVSLLSNEKYEASVRRLSPSKKWIENGTIVIGRVALLKEQSALIELLEGNFKGEQRVMPSLYASLMIFNISSNYVESIKQELRLNDLVRARVVDVKPYNIELSIAEPELGVIKAFCVKCRSPLTLLGSGLKCLSCANEETRKTAADYTLH